MRIVGFLLLGYGSMPNSEGVTQAVYPVKSFSFAVSAWVISTVVLIYLTFFRLPKLYAVIRQVLSHFFIVIASVSAWRLYAIHLGSTLAEHSVIADQAYLAAALFVSSISFVSIVCYREEGE